MYCNSYFFLVQFLAVTKLKWDTRENTVSIFASPSHGLDYGFLQMKDIMKCEIELNMKWNRNMKWRVKQPMENTAPPLPQTPNSRVVWIKCLTFLDKGGQLGGPVCTVHMLNKSFGS